MTKGEINHRTTKRKQHTKKCDFQEEEQDTEMQISNMKTAPPIVMTENENTSVKIRNDNHTSIPTVATIWKECDGSISTELTTNKTDTSSSHVVCTVNIQVDEKPKAVGNKNVKKEKDKPIDKLSKVKTDAVIRVVTDYIYPTCQFVASADHFDQCLSKPSNIYEYWTLAS